MLFGIRIIVGLSEGVAIPALVSLVAAWFPALERSRALSAVTSGQLCGTIAAFGCAPLVDAHWPSIFYLFGGLGLVWALAFQLLATSYPHQHSWVSEAERRVIGNAPPSPIHRVGSNFHCEPSCEGPSSEDGGRSADSGRSMDGSRSGTAAGGEHAGAVNPASYASSPAKNGDTHAHNIWQRMAREPAFLSICACHFGNNWAGYLLLSWLPLYLTSLGLELKHSGLLFSAPCNRAWGSNSSKGGMPDPHVSLRCGCYCCGCYCSGCYCCGCYCCCGCGFCLF